MRRAVLLVVVAVFYAATSPRAASRTLTIADIDEAIRTGQTRIAADRTRFHAPYRLLVSQAPVDYVEVITPYRRVVLAADQRAQMGERSFGQRQALELLNAAAGQFDVVVELTFHPLNTFVSMPPYEVVLMRGSERIGPSSLDRQPRYGARVEGLPPPLAVVGGRIPGGVSQPMLGGTVIARFAGEPLDADGSMDLSISEQGKELARVKIDLGRLR